MTDGQTGRRADGRIGRRAGGQLASLVILLSVCPSARLPAQCPNGTPPPCARANLAAASAPPHGSIAVMPFANRSADPNDAYLAEELPEQITGRLSRISQLRVTSATAVAAQWHRTPDALASARALRTEWLVTGSLRRMGDQLSASVELVNTASAEQAWASVIRRGDGDLAAIEATVAESVAIAVGGRLAPAQQTALRRNASSNPEAYRQYLYARSLASRRTREDIDAAGRALENAVRLEPNFAGAWARLSFVRSLQTQYGTTLRMDRDSLLVLSRAAVDRALALDRNSSEGWLAMGLWYTIQLQPMEAYRAVNRAISLDSLDADAEHAMGYLYSAEVLGLPDEAEAHFRRALELNPDLRNSWRQLGLTFLLRGRTREALAAFDSSMSHGRWLVGLADRALVRYAAGDLAGALADQAAVDSLDPNPYLASVVGGVDVRRRLYALASGDSAAALSFLAQPANSPGELAMRAMLAGALHQNDTAMAALQRLRALRDPGEPLCAPATPCSPSLRLWRAMSLPLFGSLPDDPRFQRLKEEVRPRVPWLTQRTGPAR